MLQVPLNTYSLNGRKFKIQVLCGHKNPILHEIRSNKNIQAKPQNETRSLNFVRLLTDQTEEKLKYQGEE